MRGVIFGSCNCDWGCPCNFQAPPTYGFCDGFYCTYVEAGAFGEIPLDNVKFLWGGHAPAAIHQGGGTSILILDEATTPEQRAALETLWRGGGVGSPFDEFASVTETWYDPIVTPIEMQLDGIRSKARVGGGSIFELEMERVRNPVTGEEEVTILDHPTGFTSTRSELGTSKVARLVSEHMTYDHSGKYAEYAEFSYRGP
jgi:hypothetical protein